MSYTKVTHGQHCECHTCKPIPADAYGATPEVGLTTSGEFEVVATKPYRMRDGEIKPAIVLRRHVETIAQARDLVTRVSSPAMVR